MDGIKQNAKENIKQKNQPAKVSNESFKVANESEEEHDSNYPMHWAFSAVKKTIEEHGELDSYTCASGVTPSGTVHIGNFREMITTDLVKRAFKRMGKKVRHIHSWDNFDVFRKVPKNMPKQDVLEKCLRMSIVDTPDTTGNCQSYDRMNMKEVEETVPMVGINPEYKYQAEMYRACKYSEDIKKALDNTLVIIEILNKYREEPLEAGWLPITMFCEACKKDTITKLEWNGGYEAYYECECNHKEQFDFRKKGLLKLLWRVDWPMRWNYEKVNFEPGGKDHSMPGSSYTTGQEIVQKVWGRKAPTYIMYDFISIKGRGGKISSSSGEVVTLKDCLEIYEPEIIRYLFAGTRPNAEFAISFDLDVNKIYEDYDKCERIYYKKEDSTDKECEKNKWIYELSQVDEDVSKLPKEMPLQISFREVTTALCIKRMDAEKTFEFFKTRVKSKNDERRLKTRITCAKNWIEKYADANFKFSVNETKREDFFASLNDTNKKALSMLKEAVSNYKDVEDLNAKIFEIPKALNIPMPEFFKLAYQAIISKERGPKLAAFIDEIGKDVVLKLL